ncbi:MAG: 5'-nucleotidase C-terminal domain-containing protein [Actinomycetota bacterium]
MSKQWRAVRRVVALTAAMMLAAVMPTVAAAQDGGDTVEAAVAERGYIAVDADGRLAGFGLFPSEGDAEGIVLAEPIVDVASTPTGRGYWMAASDGGVFSFGDATFLGSMGGIPLNQPIVAMASTATGDGYYLVASDGGVFAFGDATFFGSTGDITLNSPIVDIQPTPTGLGYWMVAADGGIFAFGDAGFFGSDGGTANAAPTVGMAATSTGAGYWLVDGLGNVSNFGDAADPVDPVEQGITVGSGIISVAPANDGQGAWLFNAEGAAYGLAGAFVATDVTAAADGDPFVGVDIVPDPFTLTVLHNNDGESSLSPDDAGTPDDASDDFGGIAFFANTVTALRNGIEPGDNASILLNSGDNFLASAALTASFELADATPGTPWYDSVALDAIDYDAFALGNHEFDFGPDRLVEFIEGFDGGDERFLSANLDFSGEAGLQALVDAGTIAPSTVVTVAGRQIGVVGATTPGLASISSPRNVVIDPMVAAAIQTEVDTMTGNGVEIIIVISHLQDVDSDIALAAELTDVDVVIAGGGDEILANEGDVLAPGDEAERPYPIIGEDADGNDVPVVTTAGDYKYVGQLILDFDEDGNLLGVVDDSGPVLVQASAGANADIQTNAVDPVEAFEAGLATTVLASSEVELESDRGSEFGTDAGKRVQETNLGNLIADAMLFEGQRIAAANGADSPQVAIQNGGGIREDDFSDGATTPFDITALDTFNLLPFANFLTVIEDVSGAELEALLESAYRELPGSNGAFAQVAGMTVTVSFDSTQAPADGGANPSVDVTDITLDGGTQILVANVDQGVTVDLVTNSFSAGGGDDYVIPAMADQVNLPASYRDALESYLTDAAGANGTVAAADYPVVAVGGGARILITDVG